MFEEVSPQFTFAEKEKATLVFWRENDIFQKSMTAHQADPPFVFLEGPHACWWYTCIYLHSCVNRMSQKTTQGAHMLLVSCTEENGQWALEIGDQLQRSQAFRIGGMVEEGLASNGLTVFRFIEHSNMTEWWEVEAVSLNAVK